MKNEPSIFPHSMYLIGLREGEIFKEPFDTRPLDLFENVPEVSLPSLSDEEIQDNLEFIKNIMDKQN